MTKCHHVSGIGAVVPSARLRGVPEDRLALGTSPTLPDLRSRRLLRRSPNQHATKHFQGYDPAEGWGWCFVDEVSLDLTGRTTPQEEPIPRYV